MPQTCQDRYTPVAPFVAHCPHCGAGMPGTPAYERWLVEGTLRYCCPYCDRQWSEHRDAVTGIQRFWTRTLAPVQRRPARVA